MKPTVSVFLLAAAVLAGAAMAGAQATPPAAAKSSPLSYTVFRDQVQPFFLEKKPGFARCYVCHSQGTTFRLQRLPEGRTTYNEDETRKNFEAIQRLVSPGNPDASRFLLMPLAHEAGGTEFHPGGKRWKSKSDPEWQRLAEWIKTVSK